MWSPGSKGESLRKDKPVRVQTSLKEVWLSPQRAEKLAGLARLKLVWSCQTSSRLPFGVQTEQKSHSVRVTVPIWASGPQSTRSMQGLPEGTSPGPQELAELTSVSCVTCQGTGGYGICFRVERATERLFLGQSCKIIDGWHLMPVTGRLHWLFSHPKPTDTVSVVSRTLFSSAPYWEN